MKLVTISTLAGLPRLAQPAQRVDAVGAGHLDVHQDHVGAQLLGRGRALVAVGGLADDLDVVLHLQEGAQAPADDLVVVDHAGPGSAQPPGHLHRRTVPVPAPGRTHVEPAADAAGPVPHGDEAEVAARRRRLRVEAACRRR